MAMVSCDKMLLDHNISDLNIVKLYASFLTAIGNSSVAVLRGAMGTCSWALNYTFFLKMYKYIFCIKTKMNNVSMTV